MRMQAIQFKPLYVMMAAMLFSFFLNATSKANTCDVPVCNIPETVEQMRNQKQGARYNVLKALTEENKNSKDVKGLENLMAFAQAVKVLFQEVKEDDWMIDAANVLIKRSILGISKYSAANGQNLIDLFKQLPNQSGRYEVIQHWYSSVEDIYNADTLQELLIFAEGAQLHSIAVEDESWVAEKARGLMKAATKRLVKLDPFHEGVFQIQTNCQADCDIVPVDRMVVLNGKTLSVYFFSTQFDSVIYKFNNVTLLGDEIRGDTSTDQGAAFFTANLSRKEKTINGQIFDTKSAAGASFTGISIHTITNFFRQTPPQELALEAVKGVYQGSIGASKGELIIKGFIPKSYVATFNSHDGQQRIFFEGTFLPQLGVLELIHSDGNNSMKLVIKLTELDSTREIWTGSMFATRNGAISQVNLIKYL